MSTIQEKLKELQGKSNAANEETAPIVYMALRAGRYSLAGQLESPNALGQFEETGTEERIEALREYEARGFLVKLPNE